MPMVCLYAAGFGYAYMPTACGVGEFVNVGVIVKVAVIVGVTVMDSVMVGVKAQR